MKLEKIKELACDFMWENNKPDIKDGYQSVRKLYDDWLSQNNYHKNNLSETPSKEAEKGSDEWITQELKELDASFVYLCKMDGVKDAGHRWIEFSDKWNAFKKRLLTALPQPPKE